MKSTEWRGEEPLLVFAGLVKIKKRKDGFDDHDKNKRMERGNIAKMSSLHSNCKYFNSFIHNVMT